MPPPHNASLILLTKNHLEYVRQTLPLIRRQDYAGQTEIICVDSGSTDGTLDFMRDQGVQPHIIPPEQFHHARTRNFAATMANHEILVLLSADAIPTDTHWLGNLLAPFDDPKVGAAYGKQIPPQDTGPMRTRAMQCLYPDTRELRDLAGLDTVPLRFIRFSDANSAVRTDLWREFKWDETALVAEDHGMCYHILKKSLRVVYEPGAAVTHGHQRSLWGEFQFAVDNAISLKRMGIFDDPKLGSELAYGLQQLWRDWWYFIGSGKVGSALKALTIAAAKWVGVQLGKRENALPKSLMLRISMNMKTLDP